MRICDRICALMPSRCVVERLVLAVALIFALEVGAFATDACTDLATTPTIGGAISCVVLTVGPYTAITNILTAFTPILLVIWGLRGGFSLVARMVKSMFGALRRAG